MPSYPIPSVPSSSQGCGAWVTSPVIDYEPVPQPIAERPCPMPSGSALHRASLRPLRPPQRTPVRETPPPRSAVVFAEASLRRVIEVTDRRRPVSQLRPLMTPFLIDCVIACAEAPRTGSATLRKVRVRSVDTGTEVGAAEVFASFTRAGRVHAIAGRIERHRDSWRLVALQIG